MGQLYRTDSSAEPKRAFRDLRQTEPHPSKPSENITAEIQRRLPKVLLFLSFFLFLISEGENEGLDFLDEGKSLS